MAYKYFDSCITKHVIPTCQIVIMIPPTINSLELFSAEKLVTSDTCLIALCPSAQQCHNPSTEEHAGERIQKLPEARLPHFGTE
jgi:hypothetical protein